MRRSLWHEDLQFDESARPPQDKRALTTASVFESGDTGTAIAEMFASGDVSVDHLYDGVVGTASSDIVVLAEPYFVVHDIDRCADVLIGKAVIGIANPLNSDGFGSLVVSIGTSAAVDLAAALAVLHVLKAFETTFAAALGTNVVGPKRSTVITTENGSGDKATSSTAITSDGGAIDAGSVNCVHELEAVGFLQLIPRRSGRISWPGGYAILG